MAASVSLKQLTELSTALADLTAAAAASLVSVRSRRTRSSGFVWQDGLIVTADDALPDEDGLTVVLAGGETVPARIAGRDASTDIALLRVERAGLAPAPLATAAVRAGSLAVAVGCEDGTATVAFGAIARVAGPWRSLRGGEIDARIEFDGRLRRSGEGGLAIGVDGAAIGMAVFGPRRRVLVIPAATIARVAPKLASDGRIRRGYLGLGLHTVALDDERSAAMVMSVDASGPGAAAGVRQGDIITAWDGQPVAAVQALLRLLGPDSVGRTVRLALRRAGEPTEVALTVAEKPVSG